MSVLHTASEWGQAVGRGDLSNVDRDFPDLTSNWPKTVAKLAVEGDSGPGRDIAWQFRRLVGQMAVERLYATCLGWVQTM